MNALTIAALLACVSTSAVAGTLHCSFTEPFFVIDFDTATRVVTLTSPDETDPDTGAFKPRVLGEGAQIRRIWKEEERLLLEVPAKTAGGKPETIVEMRVTGQGSDGMSEHVFPFEGHYGRLIGGCASDKAPGYDAYEAYEALGVVDEQQ